MKNLKFRHVHYDFNVYGTGQSSEGGYAAVIPAFKKAIELGNDARLVTVLRFEILSTLMIWLNYFINPESRIYP